MCVIVLRMHELMSIPGMLVNDGMIEQFQIFIWICGCRMSLNSTVSLMHNRELAVELIATCFD